MRPLDLTSRRHPWQVYLPVSWTSDRQRLSAAVVPDELEFATKPSPARVMIARALDAGTAIEITVALPARAWPRCSAGPRAKGQRYSDWTLVQVNVEGGRALSLPPVPLPALVLVLVAGRR